MRRVLAQLLFILGLAISAYLTALKFLALPCLGSGGCHAILHSRYGEIFRLPVGLYGVLLWLAVIYLPDRTKRGTLLLLMSGGSLVFMLVQFAVLRGFCLYCTLHALITWAALWLHAETPRRWTAPLGLIIAFGAVLATRQHTAAHATASVSSGARATLSAKGEGLYWLGPFTEKSPALVLSLDCPSCLDLLAQLSRRSYYDTTSGPALYFKTNNANRELTLTFVAAVLSQDAAPRDAFLAATTLLLTRKDVILSSPAVAAQQLAALFPAAATRRVHATRIVTDHAAALQAAGLGEATPLLLPRDTAPQVLFKLEDLFPR